MSEDQNPPGQETPATEPKVQVSSRFGKRKPPQENVPTPEEIAAQLEQSTLDAANETATVAADAKAKRDGELAQLLGQQAADQKNKAGAKAQPEAPLEDHELLPAGRPARATTAPPTAGATGPTSSAVRPPVRPTVPNATTNVVDLRSGNPVMNNETGSDTPSNEGQIDNGAFGADAAEGAAGADMAASNLPPPPNAEAFLDNRRQVVLMQMTARQRALEQIIRDAPPDSLEAQMAQMELIGLQANLDSFMLAIDSLRRREALVINRTAEQTQAIQAAQAQGGQRSGGRQGLLSKLFSGLGANNDALSPATALFNDRMAITDEYGQIERDLVRKNAAVSAPISQVRGQMETMRRQSDIIGKDTGLAMGKFCLTREGEEWMKGVRAASVTLGVAPEDLLYQIGGWKSPTPASKAAVDVMRDQMQNVVKNSMLPEMAEVRESSTLNEKRLSALRDSTKSFTDNIESVVKNLETIPGFTVDEKTIEGLKRSIEDSAKSLHGQVDPAKATAFAETEKAMQRSIEKMMAMLSRLFGRLMGQSAGPSIQADEMGAAAPNFG